MCAVSMIMDARLDEWQRPFRPVPSQQEIDEFRRLLERAREYDRKNNQPDCELEEKRRKLKDLAKELGVEIEFV